MTYDITIYEPTTTSPDFRFTLGTGGKKTLFVIGLNPSTADDKKPDPTITKVMGYATRHGCDSFVMFNLYAQRTKDPSKLHTVFNDQLHRENLSHIITTLEKYETVSILASWGGTINERNYLKNCLADIYSKTKNKNIDWLKIGNDLTQKGHPRHPSRGAYYDLTKFDIEKYLLTLN